jgi:hypothetical protein
LLGLLFSPEDGGEMFLQNFEWLSADCTALCPGRQNSLNLQAFKLLQLAVLIWQTT